MIDVRCTNRGCNAQFGPQYQGSNCMHCGFLVEIVQVLTPGQFAGASAPQNAHLQNPILGQLTGAPGTQPLHPQNLTFGAQGTQLANVPNMSLGHPTGLHGSQLGNAQSQFLHNALINLLQNYDQNVLVISVPGTATPYGHPQGQNVYIEQEPGTATPYGQLRAPSSTYGTAFAPSIPSVPLQTATGSYNPSSQPVFGDDPSQIPQGFDFQSPGHYLLRLRKTFLGSMDASNTPGSILGGSVKKGQGRNKDPKANAASNPLNPAGTGIARLSIKLPSNGDNSENSDRKRRMGGRKDKKSEGTFQSNLKSSDGWCFHCSFPGHWDGDCDRLDADSKPKIKDSYWARFHVHDEMQNTTPVPATYLQAMYFYHELYRHGVDIANHGYARDQVLPHVQAYIKTKLDDDGLLIWKRLVSTANRDLNFLAADIRRRVTEFYNKGIHKPLAAVMDADAMGLTKSSGPNADGTKHWARWETAQFLHNLGDEPVNAQFKQESFDDMVRILNSDLESYAMRRDVDLAAANYLVSNVVNGPDKDGIIKSIMLPLECMPEPIPKTASFRTIKDQLPLPNLGTLVQIWRTSTSALNLADD